MGQTRGIYVSIVLIMLMAPLVSSSISDDSRQRGGLDFNGDWVSSVEPEIHFEWWLEWSRDKDGNSIDDRLEWLILQPSEIQQQWWKRALPGSARVFIDYNHHPTNADISALEELNVEVTFRFSYLDTVAASAPFNSILDPEGILSLPGVCLLYTSPSPRDA